MHYHLVMFSKTQNSARPTHTQIHYLCLAQFSITMCSEKAWNNSLFTNIWTNVYHFKIGHQQFPAQLNPLSYVCMYVCMYVCIIIVTLRSVCRTTQFPVIAMPVAAAILHTQCAPLLHHAAQAQLQWHNCHHTTAYKANLYTAPPCYINSTDKLLQQWLQIFLVPTATLYLIS